MLFYNIFISFLLLSASVFASNKMTYFGCPDECEAQANPSCGVKIDTDYFCALSSSFGNYCGNYVVVMETRAKAKYLVRAKVVDSCTSCPTYHVDLSKKAFTSLTAASVGKSDIIWAVYSGSGELIRGPFYNTVSEVASSYGLSNSSFVAAFKVVAQKIAANGAATGIFSVSRGENTSVKKTSVLVTKKKVITDDLKVAKTTSARKKVITTIIKKTKAQTEAPSRTASSSEPTADTNNDANEEVSVSDITSNTPTEENNEQQNNDEDQGNGYDGATPDTITYDDQISSNINPPKQNTDLYNDPVVVNNIDSGDNDRGAAVNENEDGGNHTGATVGVITAVCGTCVGAGGIGLFLMKKRNPSKYDELKKKFPDAFGQVKSRTSTIRKNISRSLSKINNNKSPSKKQYMPTSTIEDDEEPPRIAIYDNENPIQHN